MERFYFLHCLWFAVFGCFAEQNLFLSEEDGAASDPFSVSAADTSLLYMPELTANDDLSNFIEFQDDGSLPWDPFTLSTTIDGDNDSESSIFAEASNEHCSFETGLLSPGLEARDDGGATRCDNPAAAGSIDSITPNGEEPLSGAASMGIKVDSRVAPYVNLETMRLKQICPPTPNDARKILPICSSPFRKDTRWYPLDGSYDLSMCTPMSVEVLLKCLWPRNIFCCETYVDVYYWPPPGYEFPGGLLIYTAGEAADCVPLNPADRILSTPFYN